MRERRQEKRIETVIPVTITLLDTPIPPPPIDVETDNISPHGISIAFKIKTRMERGRILIDGDEDASKLVKYLLLENKMLALKFNILPKGGNLTATGSVRWCYRYIQENYYHVKAGIRIIKMEEEEKKRWQEFLSAVLHFRAHI